MYNNIQKKMIKENVLANLGSEANVLKQDIVNLAVKIGLEFKKNMAKDDIVKLILNADEEALYNEFGKYIKVPSWVITKAYGLTKRQFSDLKTIGLFKAVDCTRKGYDLFSISDLPADKNYFKNIWEEKFSQGFNKIRVEVKELCDMEPIMIELGKLFEISNYYEEFEHRNGEGYYVYFSVRSLKKEIDNSDYITVENGKLKAEIKAIKEKLMSAEQEVRNAENDIRQTEYYKEIYEENRKLRAELVGLKSDNMTIEYYKSKVKELETELEKIKNNKSNSGRKPKLDISQKEMVKVMRLRGDSIRKIAEHFGVGVATIDRILKRDVI